MRPGAALLLLGALCLAQAPSALSDDVSAGSGGIAVMGFAGDPRPEPQLAPALAQELGELGGLRVLSPQQAKFRLRDGQTIEASRVREWASSLGVDTILLGELRPARDAAGGRVLELQVRSGYSGGPVGRHQAFLREGESLERATRELAVAVLEGLGQGSMKLPAGEFEALPAVASEGPAAPLPDPSVEESEAGDSGGSRLLGDLGGKDEPLAIDSEELELIEDGDDRHLIFTRNVRVTQGDILLLTDRLEAFYPAGASQPDRLVATGQVRVHQRDRRARCNRAVYERDTQTVVCTGEAELVQNCDTVRGPQIRFDLDRDHVRVIGGASVVIQPDEASGAGCVGDAS